MSRESARGADPLDAYDAVYTAWQRRRAEVNETDSGTAPFFVSPSVEHGQHPTQALSPRRSAQPQASRQRTAGQKPSASEVPRICARQRVRRRRCASSKSGWHPALSIFKIGC